MQHHSRPLGPCCPPISTHRCPDAPRPRLSWYAYSRQKKILEKSTTDTMVSPAPASAFCFRLKSSTSALQHYPWVSSFMFNNDMQRSSQTTSSLFFCRIITSSIHSLFSSLSHPES